jgi:hypothetical protein
MHFKGKKAESFNQKYFNKICFTPFKERIKKVKLV